MYSNAYTIFALTVDLLKTPRTIPSRYKSQPSTSPTKTYPDHELSIPQFYALRVGLGCGGFAGYLHPPLPHLART